MGFIISFVSGLEPQVRVRGATRPPPVAGGVRGASGSGRHKSAPTSLGEDFAGYRNRTPAGETQMPHPGYPVICMLVGLGPEVRVRGATRPPPVAGGGKGDRRLAKQNMLLLAAGL